MNGEEVEPLFRGWFPAFVSVINDTFCWTAAEATAAGECLGFIPHWDRQQCPVVAFGEQPSLCTAFEGHSVTVSRLPSSTGWVARPQQGSLQLTPVLLSCDQEDQDHPLTVVWLARYRRRVPTGAIFLACEEKQRIVVTVGNETVLSVTRPDFSPAHLLFPS